MAEAAGMEVGDVLTRLDDLPVGSPAELQVALRSAGAAGEVEMRFERGGRPLARTVPAVRVADEEGVLYDTIDVGGVRLRTIVGRPSADRRRPALLFVQGLATTTMEGAFSELFRAWNDEGFVTMRIEKRGIGDSEGDPPERGDLITEIGDVRAALRALARYDFVDPRAVFVFGHSVGGMIAPLLDDEEHLRGLVIYGSSSERWFDCVEAGARRQCLLRGEDDAEARARAIRDEMTTQAVTDGRPAVYHRQLDEAEVAHAWSRVRRPVLVLHGEHDWVVSEAESAGIARLARGTLRIVPRVDHLFTSHDSLADSLKAHGKGRFEPTLMAECAAWMRELSSAEPV